MKTIAWVLNGMVQITLMMVLLFDRNSYVHCNDLDN